MRVMVIFGENSADLTYKVNEWLNLNSDKVITSISPAMPRDRDGAYITIIYQDKEKIFEKVE